MQLLITIAAAALCLASGTTAAAICPTNLGTAMLAKHNEYRAKHSAPPLTWDTELAKAASVAGQGCFWQDQKAPGFEDAGYNRYNFGAWYGGRQQTARELSMQAIDLWAEEETTFAPYYGQMDPSPVMGTCAHWTQMIWKATRKLGCSYTKCGDGSSKVVCAYFPAGNYNWGDSYMMNVTRT